MYQRGTSNFRLALILAMAGCASTQHTEDLATGESPKTACELTASELRTVRSNALEFLIQEWPVLEKRCERISNTVIDWTGHGCSILGGPRLDRSCERPSHFGYGIVFSKDTLEPVSIFWVTE